MLIKKEDVTSFVMWLTGHDKETVDKLFDDFNNSRERKESVPTVPLVDKLLLSEIREHYLAEVFERYLRCEHEYPSINWDEKTVEQYRNDRRYRKDVYEEMKWQNSYGYAFEFAQKRLFQKIIKETLNSNFSA